MLMWRLRKALSSVNRKITPIVIIGALASCATPPLVTVCPTPVPYAAEMQARTADELEALPADAALREMVADYIRERAQLRVGAK